MRRHRSMLMPDQLPSAAFMAKGAASLVPITNSRCDAAATSAASGACAQHGAANSVNAPVNTAIVADTCTAACIVARSGTPVTRENSIAHSRAGHRIARATPLEGDLRAVRPQRITVQMLCRFWVHRRERLAFDRMSPSFARNIATTEDFVPAGASANIQPKRNDAIVPRARSSLYCGDHGEALRMTSAATGKASSIGLRGILKAAAYALELIAIAVAYFGIAVSGLLIPWINPTATPLWPPTGLALALVLLRGYRIWPAILVGAFFSTVVGNGALSEAACIALGTPIAALAGAWLINRWSQGRDTFATPLGVAKFALIAFAPTAMISATMATVGLVPANDAGLASPVATWTARWLADAGGTLIIAPVIVLWATKPSRAWSRWSPLETAA